MTENITATRCQVLPEIVQSAKSLKCIMGIMLYLGIRYDLQRGMP